MRRAFCRSWHWQLAFEFCPAEESLQLIIVALGKRFRFMIVTARTTDRLPEKNQRGGVGHVVERVVAALDLICRINHVRAEQVEAGGDQGIGIVWKQFIARQLLADEAVV